MNERSRNAEMLIQKRLQDVLKTSQRRFRNHFRLAAGALTNWKGLLWFFHKGRHVSAVVGMP